MIKPDNIREGDVQFLIDSLIAAHYLFKDGTGTSMVNVLVENHGQYGVVLRREDFGICETVLRFHNFAQVGDDIKFANMRTFRGALKSMYGDETDPFASVPRGSYFAKRLNYALRARECLKIAKYIEDFASRMV